MGDRTDVSGLGGFPHPFLLDDLDDQSRSVHSTQAAAARTVRKIVSVEDSAANWFSRIMFSRKKHAVLLYSGISSIFFMLTTALLHLSLIHPFTSVRSAFLALVSPVTWLLLLLYVLLDSVCMMGIGVFLLKFDVEKRLSVWNYIPYIILSGFFGSDLLKKGLLMLGGYGYRGSFNDWIHLFIIGTLSFVCSLWVTFRFNYQLVFPAVELVPVTCVQAAFYTERDKVFKVMLTVAKWTVAFVIIVGIPWFGWRVLGALVDVRCYFSWVLLCFLQLYSHYIGVSILKGYVLQRHTFELPEVHLGMMNPLKDAPNLITALESSSVTLKAFALWDLRDLAIKNRDRRAVIYSLSRPGGHPRNWDAVKEVCVGILQRVKSQIEQETSQIQRENYASLVAIDDKGKSTTKSGPTILLASQLYKDKNLRKRILNSDSGDGHTEPSSSVDTWAAFLTLGMLIWHSYDEDEYGVVQKDLGFLLTLLIQLIVGLNRYIRHNKQTSDETVLSNLTVVYGLDSSLCSTVNRIACKFGTALGSVGLSPLELDVLESITGLRQDLNIREQWRR